MNKNYKVYMHTCPNNKKYIGITYCVEQRWGKNGYGYRNSRLFSRAIKKYGWDNIKHEILYDNLSLNEAMQKEIELIAKYKTNDNKYGYNISLGGDLTTKGYKFTKKQRENLSKAKFEPIYCIEDDKYYYSMQEIKDNKIKGCRKAATGERNTYLGKHYILAKDIEKYKSGRYKLKDNGKKRTICLETKKIYNSLAEAERDTKCPANSISECCNNKLKSCRNLHWQYYDDNFDISRCEEIIKEKQKMKNKNSKKVICIETGIIYESPTVACKSLKITHIAECCRGIRTTAGGYRWKYLSEVMDNEI